MKTVVLIAIAVFFIVMIFSENDKEKGSGSKKGRALSRSDLKKLDNIDKASRRLEKLQQEQEISRISSQFSGNTQSASNNTPNIKLNRNY